jgi:undecaprenyl-diphosphatase
MRPTPPEFLGRLRTRAAGELLSLLFVLGVLGVGFLVLSDEVRERSTQTFDEQVLRALRDPAEPGRPRGPRWLAESARDVTALGSMTVLALVVVAVGGFLALVRRWRTLALVLVSTLGGVGVNTLLKDVVARPRPSVVPHLTEVLSASFPSGHAMLSAIVYLTLAALLSELVSSRWHKAYLVTVGLGLTLLIGLTRMYLGVHYPTDVLGGWMAGLGWALLSGLVARVARRKSPGLREEARGDTAPP